MRTLKTSTIRTARASLLNIARNNPHATVRMRGENWTKIRRKWLTANPLCVMCEAHGYVNMADHIDHIVPLFKGGDDNENNYQSLCVECHRIKTKEDLKNVLPRI